MENVIKFMYNGYEATVIRPENPNGKWVWKTEFLYAFDGAERELCSRGYTRVYYSISNKYGSYHAVRLMHEFQKHVVKEFGLEEKCMLFGFSRGGLYAFNYALFYPECVEKIYLDAPVLDMRTWPEEGSPNREQVYDEYNLTPETIKTFKGHPVENFREFFAHSIPLLLVAGAADEIVPYEANSGRMLDFCAANGISITSYVKPECKHHPHSLDDPAPIVDFIVGGN